VSDLLQDFETFYTALGLVSAGTFFRDTMPDKPDSSTALYEYGSSLPVPQIAGALRSIQVVTRDLNATTAKTKARALFNALETEDGILYLTVDRWTTISLKQLPFKLKVDDKERVYYCFNLDVITYKD
jgi:hypothetical protein